MSESFDKQIEVADVYAAALFDLASERGQVDAVREELDGLARLEETDPTFAGFLSSNAVDEVARRASLERMFRGRISDTLLDTLGVLSGHGRASLLRPLLRCFTIRQEHAAGQIEARVTSAIELSVAQKESASRLAAELSGKKPLVEFRVEPEIVGGLIMQLGDYRYDNSVRRQLHVARVRLLERSARGLPVGSGQAR